MYIVVEFSADKLTENLMQKMYNWSQKYNEKIIKKHNKWRFAVPYKHCYLNYLVEHPIRERYKDDSLFC